MGAYVRALRAWQAFQLGEQGKLSRPDGITEEEEEEEEAEEMGKKGLITFSVLWDVLTVP